VELATSGLTVRVVVKLVAQGRSFRGEATGTTAATGVNRSVAVATLAAVEAAAGHRVAFDVDQLEVVIRGGERAVLVVATMTSTRGSEPLAGAAIVREDVHRAVIMASLDAVNRRVSPFLTG
jgi:hypothetical protein